jgi:hypothetical protein
MNRRVNWDRKSFAILAQVEVGTIRVHALRMIWLLGASRI